MIYCTVGVIGSGKTTWSRKQGKRIISDDDLRTMLYGKYEYREEDELALKKGAIALAIQLSYSETDVIIDSAAWFLTIEARRHVWQSISLSDRLPQITWVVFPIPSREQIINWPTTKLRGISITRWLEVYEKQKAAFNPNISTVERTISISQP